MYELRSSVTSMRPVNGSFPLTDTNPSTAMADDGGPDCCCAEPEQMKPGEAAAARNITARIHPAGGRTNDIDESLIVPFFTFLAVTIP